MSRNPTSSGKQPVVGDLERIVRAGRLKSCANGLIYVFERQPLEGLCDRLFPRPKSG